MGQLVNETKIKLTKNQKRNILIIFAGYMVAFWPMMICTGIVIIGRGWQDKYKSSLLYITACSLLFLLIAFFNDFVFRITLLEYIDISFVKVIKTFYKFHVLLIAG